MKILQRNIQVKLKFYFNFLDLEEEEDKETIERTTRPKCSLCHQYKFIKDVQARNLSKKEREQYFHSCPKVPCTNYRTCPTKWLMVRFIQVLLNFQRHPKAKKKMKEEKKIETQKKKEEINNEKGNINFYSN